MIIAIDFDDTYTRDPELWDEFCRSCIRRGHKVYCVTARAEGKMMDIVKESIGKVIGEKNCIGTNLQPKRNFLLENYKIYIDVWCDDTPDAIVDNIYSGFNDNLLI